MRSVGVAIAVSPREVAIFGVGFVAHGTRTLSMELVARAGAIWIGAAGPVVPGFSGL
jgi:hypothetical protein